MIFLVRNVLIAGCSLHSYWLLYRFFVTYAGLNVEVDRILEIACVVTDGNLAKSIEVSLSLSGHCDSKELVLFTYVLVATFFLGYYPFCRVYFRMLPVPTFLIFVFI